jgi:hypothetical protein
MQHEGYRGDKTDWYILSKAIMTLTSNFLPLVSSRVYLNKGEKEEEKNGIKRIFSWQNSTPLSEREKTERCLEHESSDSGGSTDETHTGREARSGVGGLLGERGRGGVADGVTRGLDSGVVGRSASGSRDHGGGVRSLGGVAVGGSNGGGRANGVDSWGRSNWVTSGGSRARGGRGAAGGGGSRGRGLDLAALAGRDTELGAVLVLASLVVDDLETVAGVTLGDGQVGSGSPGEATAVDDALSERGTELDDVARGALEEENGDRVEGGRSPGDLEGLALGDDLVQRTGDGVSLGLASGRGDLGSSKAGEEDDGGVGVHVCLFVCFL